MRERWAGIAGIVIALLGLTASVVAEHVMDEPLRAKLAGAVDLSVGGVSVRLGTPEQTSKSFFSRQRVRRAGTVLGLAALPLAIVSWARRERAWWGFGTCSFAVAAIAWQTFVVVFALLLLTGAIFEFVPRERD